MAGINQQHHCYNIHRIHIYIIFISKIRTIFLTFLLFDRFGGPQKDLVFFLVHRLRCDFNLNHLWKKKEKKELLFGQIPRDQQELLYQCFKKYIGKSNVINVYVKRYKFHGGVDMVNLASQIVANEFIRKHCVQLSIRVKLFRQEKKQIWSY